MCKTGNTELALHSEQMTTLQCGEQTEGEPE